MSSNHKRLGELLLEAKLLEPEHLDAAITEQKKTGQMLGAVLVQMGFLKEAQLMSLLQRQLSLPLVDLETAAVDEQALLKIKEDMARRYLALPVEIEGRKTLVVAMSDPLNVAALEDLRFHAGMFIRPVLAAPSQLQEAIERYYHLDSSMNEVVQSIIQSENEVVVNAVADSEERQAIDELMREAEGRPIVRLANWLLHRAVEEGASDIHIEPQNNELIVRFRVDGLLREEQRLPKWTQSAIVSRIKVLSNLDIAEKRIPQDGRLVAEIGGRRIDMRVSTLPLTNGEKVVMRVVDTKRRNVELQQLGMSDHDLRRVRAFLERPQGIVLVTGPTGSGKTTLLYAALQHLRDVTRNITTVEDPVEVQLPGLNQVQVDEKAKKTFAVALRAILRQDPDVIMIGEIRDRETAQIAFRAEHGTHERRRRRRDPTGGPRARALHGREFADRRGEHPPRAGHLHTLPRRARGGLRDAQPARRGGAERCAREALPRSGLPDVPPDRLRRTHGDLRGAGGGRHDAQSHGARRGRGRGAEPRGAGRHAPDRRGRTREDAARGHHARRGDARGLPARAGREGLRLVQHGRLGGVRVLPAVRPLRGRALLELPSPARGGLVVLPALRHDRQAERRRAARARGAGQEAHDPARHPVEHPAPRVLRAGRGPAPGPSCTPAHGRR